MSAGDFAGRLRERVAVERWRRSSDAFGGDPGSWIAEGAAWAAITALPVRPDEDGATLSTKRRYRVEMRAKPMLTLEHRLLWQGQVLSLLAVERDPATPDRIGMIAEVRG